MKRLCLTLVLALSSTLIAAGQHAKLPGIAAAMEEMIAKQEIAGAVTAVVNRNDLLHLDTTGYADIASKREMRPDTLFWIASMTKPVTGVAVLMLQDEGKLKVADPVAKYLPEFSTLKTPSAEGEDAC
jgi:CubicO group peptidase (beta-lactamase class C family)